MNQGTLNAAPRDPEQTTLLHPPIGHIESTSPTLDSRGPVCFDAALLTAGTA